MLDGRFRKPVDAATKPIGKVLATIGLTADAMTAGGLVFSAAAAVLIGSGNLAWGTALLVLTALCDLLDGPVANARGTASVRGAFFDSVADRWVDTMLLGGIAWYLGDTKGGVWAVLPMAVLGISSIISYTRAKGELLGFTAKGGLMERAERTVVLAVAVAFEVLLLPLLWVLLGLSTITAIARFVKVWKQATAATRQKH